MALAIKNIPVLKKKEAIKFNNEAAAAFEKKGTVKFEEQLAVAAKILAKAKR